MKVVQVYGAYYLAPDTKGFPDGQSAYLALQRYDSHAELVTQANHELAECREMNHTLNQQLRGLRNLSKSSTRSERYTP